MSLKPFHEISKTVHARAVLCVPAGLLVDRAGTEYARIRPRRATDAGGDDYSDQ